MIFSYYPLVALQKYRIVYNKVLNHCEDKNKKTNLKQENRRTLFNSFSVRLVGEYEIQFMT